MLVGNKHDDNIMTDQIGYEHIAKYCRNLEKLTLGNCSRLDEFHLIDILKSCGGKLAYLSITPKFVISSATIDAIVNSCNKLTSLKLCKICLMSSLIDIIMNCQLMISLDMSGCSFHNLFNWVLFTTAVIDQIQLKDLYFCKRITNKEEIQVLKKNSEKNVFFV
jgi:hypothetical protein